MCLFYRQICCYCSLQGHAEVHRACFGFAGVLPLQKGLHILEELMSLVLVLDPDTWVPLLSEQGLGWLAEVVSHRWNELPSRNPITHTHRALISERKASAQPCLYMSSCKCWEVSVDFFQRLHERRFGIYKATRLMHVFV